MKWKDAFAIISAAVAVCAMVVSGVNLWIAGILSIFLGVAVWWAWTYYLASHEKEEDAIETSKQDERSLRRSIKELDESAQAVNSEEISALVQVIEQNARLLWEQFEVDKVQFALERRSVIDRIEIATKLVTQWQQLERLGTPSDDAHRSFSTIRSYLEQTTEFFSNLNTQIRLGKLAEISSTVEAMNEIGQISIGVFDQQR